MFPRPTSSRRTQATDGCSCGSRELPVSAADSPRQGTGDEVESNARHLIDGKRECEPGARIERPITKTSTTRAGATVTAPQPSTRTNKTAQRTTSRPVAITAWRRRPSIRSARSGDSVLIVVLAAIVVGQRTRHGGTALLRGQARQIRRRIERRPLDPARLRARVCPEADKIQSVHCEQRLLPSRGHRREGRHGEDLLRGRAVATHHHDHVRHRRDDGLVRHRLATLDRPRRVDSCPNSMIASAEVPRPPITGRWFCSESSKRTRRGVSVLATTPSGCPARIPSKRRLPLRALIAGGPAPSNTMTSDGYMERTPSADSARK